MANPADCDDLGTFEEMLTLASERSDGYVVIHRRGCDYPNECYCQPRIVRPYEPVDEAVLQVN